MSTAAPVDEESLHATTPLSVLYLALKNGNQILISLRSNRKLLARIRAFDRHCNMVLENCLETWTEQPRAGKGKKGKSIQRERFINTMFLRGDGVILGKEKTSPLH